jgi:hypothetical protein
MYRYLLTGYLNSYEIKNSALKSLEFDFQIESLISIVATYLTILLYLLDFFNFDREICDLLNI